MVEVVSSRVARVIIAEVACETHVNVARALPKCFVSVATSL
jgi:hypothetical protein